MPRLRARGVRPVNDVTPDAITAMRKRVKPVYEKPSQTIGPDVVERLNETLATVRGQ